MRTPKPQHSLVRRWAAKYSAELTTLGLQSLRDHAGTLYTIEPLTFAVFSTEPIRQQYIGGLFQLAERRRAQKVAQWAVDYHTRQLRRWCRDQLLKSRARGTPVMVGDGR